MHPALDVTPAEADGHLARRRRNAADASPQVTTGREMPLGADRVLHLLSVTRARNAGYPGNALVPYLPVAVAADDQRMSATPEATRLALVTAGALWLGDLERYGQVRAEAGWKGLQSAGTPV